MVILMFEARDKAEDLLNALADDRIIAVCGSRLDAGARLRELKALLRGSRMPGFAVDFLRLPRSVCVGFAFDAQRFKRSDARYWALRSYRHKRCRERAGMSG